MLALALSALALIVVFASGLQHLRLTGALEEARSTRDAALLLAEANERVAASYSQVARGHGGCLLPVAVDGATWKCPGCAVVYAATVLPGAGTLNWHPAAALDVLTRALERVAELDEDWYLDPDAEKASPPGPVPAASSVPAQR